MTRSRRRTTSRPARSLYQALAVPTGVAATFQVVSSVAAAGLVVLAAFRATPAASYLVAVVASQLLSPVLWDHYAMLLLLPAAWLLARGHAWAVAIPLATSVVALFIAPAAIYPAAFWVGPDRRRRGRHPGVRSSDERGRAGSDGLTAVSRPFDDTAEPEIRAGLLDRHRPDGARRAHLLALEPLLRRLSRRLLLSRRRVPPRPDMVRSRVGAARLDRRERRHPGRRPLLRAVRAVPGDLLHAARRDHRPGQRGPVGDGDQRAPRRERRSASVGGSSAASAFAR